jgi:hypothetical protein
MKKLSIFIIILILLATGFCFYITSQSGITKRAQTFCDLPDVVEVRINNNNEIEVVSKLLGGGTTYYSALGQKLEDCPIVAPDSQSEVCKARFDDESLAKVVCTKP